MKCAISYYLDRYGKPQKPLSTSGVRFADLFQVFLDDLLVLVSSVNDYNSVFQSPCRLQYS